MLRSARSTSYAEGLQHAAEVVGGEDKLAGYLRVDRDQLSAWLSGAAEPPAHLFMDALDLITYGELFSKVTDKTAGQRARREF